MNDLHLFSTLSTIVAGVVIALGTMLPAIAMGRAIAGALDAMIESLAIYCLVIALILLFRNPLLEYFLK
jgi:F-type H+-transporting ATPase subunit c